MTEKSHFEDGGFVRYATSGTKVENQSYKCSGTLGVNVADALTSLSTSLVFDGDDVTLDLKDKPQTMNAALVETPGISGHRITASGNVCLTLNGANQVDTAFPGKVTGKASICWNPSEDARLTLSGTADTTGALIVLNGTIDVSAATVSSLTRFEVGDAGRLALPSGARANIISTRRTIRFGPWSR